MATLTDTFMSEQTFSEKLHSYLIEQPCACDVTFLVGPEKEKINAVKLVLVASSLVFRKLFELNWDMDANNQKKEISMPHMDAIAFKIFLKLLPSEHINVGTLQKLELTADQIFSLITISKLFGMTTMQKAFEDMGQLFITHFDTYAGTKDFLNLSSTNLETILKSDDLRVKEIDIFTHAWRWAENKCSEQDLPSKPENIRKVFGGIIKEIRFPLMTNVEFGRTVCPKDILTAEEMLEIFRYIALDEDDRITHNGKLVGFKTASRIQNGSECISKEVKIKPENQILSHRLFEQELKATGSPSLVCNGFEYSNLFYVNEKIEVLGFGFAGPAESAGEYVIEVEPKLFINSNYFSLGRTRQQIQANRQQTTHYMLENPIVCDPLLDPTTYSYAIDYNLKGPNIQVFSKTKDKMENQLDKNQFKDIEFKQTWVSYPLVGILYRKLEKQ